MQYNPEWHWNDTLTLLAGVAGLVALLVRLLIVLDRLSRETTRLAQEIHGALEALTIVARELRDHVVDTHARYEQINARLMWLEQRKHKWEGTGDRP